MVFHVILQQYPVSGVSGKSVTLDLKRVRKGYDIMVYFPLHMYVKVAETKHRHKPQILQLCGYFVSTEGR